MAQLKQSGFLASRPGIGMVITAPKLPSREERLNQLKPICRDLLKEANELDLEVKDVLEAVRRTAQEAGSSTRGSIGLGEAL